jgi:SWI/SNF-related matrix-associated actin-dependent regulator 1 of chromatin subfamily A
MMKRVAFLLALSAVSHSHRLKNNELHGKRLAFDNVQVTGASKDNLKLSTVDAFELVEVPTLDFKERRGYWMEPATFFCCRASPQAWADDDLDDDFDDLSTVAPLPRSRGSSLPSCWARGGSEAKSPRANKDCEDVDVGALDRAFLDGEDYEDEAYGGALAAGRPRGGAKAGAAAYLLVAIPRAVVGGVAGGVAVAAHGLVHGLRGGFGLAAVAAVLAATPWGQARLRAARSTNSTASAAAAIAAPAPGSEHLGYVAELEERLLALEAAKDEAVNGALAQVEAAKRAVVKKASVKIDALVAVNKKLKADVAGLQRRAASKGASGGGNGASGSVAAGVGGGGPAASVAAVDQAAAVARAVAAAVAAAEDAAAEEADALRHDLAFASGECQAAVAARTAAEQQLRAATAAAADAQGRAAQADARAAQADAQAAHARAAAAEAAAAGTATAASFSLSAKAPANSGADAATAVSAAVAAAVAKEAQRLGAAHAEELRRLQAVMQAALAKQKAAKHKSKTAVRVSHIRVSKSTAANATVT